ncbi:YbaB/EbfC family nucleoid-associated protein [Spirosoma sp. KCTC 42546]|uniref:YbaB/EbfC family nucleoid-associated protein n=1 Tax=Spirosoma sp. KCTC 42546 TaxID=2520506 RepID=UPI00115A0F37|nr:YbaB/EbfC family nucleoid-associated protein [Spirosoma sp. KCTC 42546]QDK82401.1 YbaB/EbfC family nucleoid-associated protein [Spirosoma sp. KCTC 42546]
MNQEKIMQLQALISKLEERVQSPDGKITITFNGQCQIKEMHIPDGVPASTLQTTLPVLINTGLLTITEKIKSIAASAVA